MSFLSTTQASTPIGLKLARAGVWSLCYFAFYFIQQLAELFAPLLLIAGVAWKALPVLIGAVSHVSASADPQARDAIANVAAAIPEQITLAGHTLTASGMIWDGILLMGLAAAGATLATLAGRNM
ncbi:hypothetical protein AD949_12715 [Acetobacter orleanensis]|nr:hypothetical protein AD949_12715 [Acetobacter orleanensis]